MKYLSFLLLLLFSLTTAATNSYGRYKLDVDFEGMEETVVFLMNSSADVEIIQDENYYTIKSIPFFTEVTLDIVSGGDDEHFKINAVIGEMNGETVLLNFCAAAIYSSNSMANTVGQSVVKLSKWNKRSKKYEALKVVATVSEVLRCEENLLAEEAKMGFDIYEY
jgi:hypothetical protein